MARWVRRRVRAGRVLAIANQRRGVLEQYGISSEEADRAAWTIDRNGNRLEGAAAINQVLDELGGGWRILAALYRSRAVATVEESFYRWFAKNRSRFHRLGVTPACDEPEADCS